MNSDRMTGERMGLYSILFCIPAAIGIGIGLLAVFGGDAVKKHRNVMTATAIAVYKGKELYLLNNGERSIHYLEYEFYAPEDCCKHTVSSECFFPFLRVSKRKRTVKVCYDPRHPTTNAIINENGKIIGRPYQIIYLILALFLISFSVFLFVVLP